MLNEYTAKKLGEVLAFNRISTDTLEKGRSALVEMLGEEKVLDIEEKNRIHGQELMRIATDSGVIDATLSKADTTFKKLSEMRQIYVADQWDNAGELLEWGGFFEGATIVHWALVRGIAEAINHEGLLLLCTEAINWHYEMLEMVESELAAIGQDRSME